MEYIHNLIWLCPLLFIAGFIDSIAGGGGLIALPAYMMCGMPIYYVYGCNKFQCAFGSTVAAWKYFKNGCLDLKITLISAVTSFLCSMLGTRIIFYLKEEQIRSMLMVLLPWISPLYFGGGQKKCRNTAFSDKIQAETCPSILNKNPQKVNWFSAESTMHMNHA